MEKKVPLQQIYKNPMLKTQCNHFPDTAIKQDDHIIEIKEQIEILLRLMSEAQITIQALRADIVFKMKKRRRRLLKPKSPPNSTLRVPVVVLERLDFVHHQLHQKSTAAEKRRSPRLLAKAKKEAVTNLKVGETATKKPPNIVSLDWIHEPGYTWTSYLNGSIWGGVPRLVLKRIRVGEEYDPPVRLPTSDLIQLRETKEKAERRAARRARRLQIQCNSEEDS